MQTYSRQELLGFLADNLEIRFPTGSGFKLAFSQTDDNGDESLLYKDVKKLLEQGILKDISTFASVCIPYRYSPKDGLQVYIVIYKNTQKRKKNAKEVVYTESPVSKLLSTLEREAGIYIDKSVEDSYEVIALREQKDNEISDKMHRKIAYLVKIFEQKPYFPYGKKEDVNEKIKEGGWISVTLLKEFLWNNHKQWILEPLLEKIQYNGTLPKIRNSSH